MTSKAPTGSTIPLRPPMRKDLMREFPAARIGIEMMAPSGTFWTAIPIAVAIAAAGAIAIPSLIAPATSTPTAIPSGILCIVTAKASMAVFEIFDFGPSGLSSPM